MTKGPICNCEEARKPLDKRKWRVTRRNFRCSAFDGYRQMPSNASDVWCPGCGRVWRTQAAYVSQLPDGKYF